MRSEDLLQQAKRRGWLDDLQIEIARAEAQETGDDIGEVLIENRFLTAEQLKELRQVDALPETPAPEPGRPFPWVAVAVGVLIAGFVAGLVFVATREKGPGPKRETPPARTASPSAAPPRFKVPPMFGEVPEADIVIWFNAAGRKEISLDHIEGVEEGAMALDHNGELLPLWVQVLRGNFNPETLRHKGVSRGYRLEEIDGRSVFVHENGFAMYLRTDLLVFGTRELVLQTLAMRADRGSGFRPSTALRTCIEKLDRSNLLITLPRNSLGATCHRSGNEWTYQGAIRTGDLEPERLSRLLQEWRLVSLDYEVGHLLMFTMVRPARETGMDAETLMLMVAPLEAIRP